MHAVAECTWEAFPAVPVDRPGAVPAGAAEDAAEQAVLKAAVAKLHTNLGHPSNEALARAIRLTGGSDAAIAIALAHRCPTCQRLESGNRRAAL